MTINSPRTRASFDGEVTILHLASVNAHTQFRKHRCGALKLTRCPLVAKELAGMQQPNQMAAHQHGRCRLTRASRSDHRERGSIGAWDPTVAKVFFRPAISVLTPNVMQAERTSGLGCSLRQKPSDSGIKTAGRGRICQLTLPLGTNPGFWVFEIRLYHWRKRVEDCVPWHPTVRKRNRRV
jgi:hypothetical protein